MTLRRPINSCSVLADSSTGVCYAFSRNSRRRFVLSSSQESSSASLRRRTISRRNPVVNHTESRWHRSSSARTSKMPGAIGLAVFPASPSKTRGGKARNFCLSRKMRVCNRDGAGTEVPCLLRLPHDNSRCFKIHSAMRISRFPPEYTQQMLAFRRSRQKCRAARTRIDSRLLEPRD